MKGKEYYITKYEDRIAEIYEEFVDDGIIDKDLFCENWFGETANAEEVVGYYFVYYKDDAMKTWLKNTKHIEMTEQDKEVTEIFKELANI